MVLQFLKGRGRTGEQRLWLLGVGLAVVVVMMFRPRMTASILSYSIREDDLLLTIYHSCRGRRMNDRRCWQVAHLQRDRHEAIQEFIHLDTAQRDHAADGQAFADLESQFTIDHRLLRDLVTDGVIHHLFVGPRRHPC